jgi:diguanylate cyclase (GGDEF)-like protein
MRLNELILEVDGDVGFLEPKEYLEYLNFEEVYGRRSVLLIQVMAIFACASAYYVNPSIVDRSGVFMLIFASVMLMCLFISAKSFEFFTGAFARIVFSIFCSKFLILISGESENFVFWHIAICSIVLVAMSTLHYEPISYLIASCFICIGGLVPDWEGILQNSERGWLFCLLFSSIFFGVFVNFRSFFDRVRIYKGRRYLVDLAYKDVLTKINNRRALIHKMNNDYAKINGEEKYILLIDVDDFKKINDRYGHDVGDKVLISIADALKNNSEVDLCGRLGGDEFAVLKKGSLLQACHLANSLSTKIESSFAGGIEVTISIGIALWEPKVTLSDAMRFADEELYRAKRGGRNRYSVFGRDLKVVSEAVENL